MFNDVKNILIIKLRNIGDVLLTVPAIQAIKRNFPHARLSVLVNKGTEEMISGNPYVDDVIVYDRKIKNMPPVKRISKEVEFARYLRSRGFDMVVDLTGGDRSAFYSLLSGAKYRIGYISRKNGFMWKSRIYTHKGNKFKGRSHMVIQNLHLVRQFGIDTDDITVNISFSRNDEEFVEKILYERGIDPSDSFVHIHPVSRWLFKCWKDEYMAKIIDFCEKDMGIRVVLTSGTDEIHKIKSILNHVKSSPVDLSGKLTLKHLAALSKRASLFFGIDSAPMHIAAAMGTPVIALFGPTGVFDWGPWDNTAQVSPTPYPGKNGLQRTPLHTVIQKDWDCIPCGQDGCNGSKKSECLEAIEVQDVIRLLKEKLSDS